MVWHHSADIADLGNIIDDVTDTKWSLTSPMLVTSPNNTNTKWGDNISDVNDAKLGDFISADIADQVTSLIQNKIALIGNVKNIAYEIKEKNIFAPPRDRNTWLPTDVVKSYFVPDYIVCRDKTCLVVTCEPRK